MAAQRRVRVVSASFPHLHFSVVRLITTLHIKREASCCGGSSGRRWRCGGTAQNNATGFQHTCSHRINKKQGALRQASVPSYMYGEQGRAVITFFPGSACLIDKTAFERQGGKTEKRESILSCQISSQFLLRENPEDPSGPPVRANLLLSTWLQKTI